MTDDIIKRVMAFVFIFIATLILLLLFDANIWELRLIIMLVSFGSVFFFFSDDLKGFGFFAQFHWKIFGVILWILGLLFFLFMLL